MFVPSEPRTPPSVYSRPSEEPTAEQNQTISKRLQVAQILVDEEKDSGFCSGSADDLDHALDYLDDCAETMGNIDRELDAIIEDSNKRRAA